MILLIAVDVPLATAMCSGLHHTQT